MSTNLTRRDFAKAAGSAAIGMTASTYTDTIAGGTTRIKAVHFEELRAAMR